MPAVAVALKALPSQVRLEEYADILDVIKVINRPIIERRKQLEELEKNREEIEAKQKHDRWIKAQRKALGIG